MTKILINATNARNVGGGMQVVVNFLLATVKYPNKDIEWYYAVSQRLDDDHLPEEFKQQVAGRYFVFPNQPDFRHSYRNVQKQLYKLEAELNIDLVFTPLGPSYHFFKSKEVIRFTNAWVMSANKFAWRTVHGTTYIKMKLQNILLKHLISRRRFVVTQAETIKKDLVTKLDFKPDNIRVVRNVLPAAYKNMSREHISGWENTIDIAAIGAGEHKNLDIIPEILHLLESKYNITNYRFHITLPDSSPILPVINSKLSEYGCAERVINHGNLKQPVLAEVYRNCDLCFLPSVLEVFSVSTIEAMYFRLPTLATNLPFNTEVLADSCLYYKPMDAVEATERLIRLASDMDLRQELIAKMDERLKQFSDFEDYYHDTVNFLVEAANK